jgi:ATP-dependent DNA ligase
VVAAFGKAWSMALPLARPYPPMEAQLVEALPSGESWQYEPKWDGFRGLLFRDGTDVYLQSKSGQDLTRYFPELVEAALQLAPKRFILDGEIVIPVQGRISFDDLLMRIHPAPSRIRRLASETPAKLIVFDLLVDERGRSLVDLPLAERRERLERFAEALGAHERFALSPFTTEFRMAKRWLENPSTGLDGVMAKRTDLPYRSGERDAMQKVKRQRTADCVVGGFRYASKERVVGSLLLGLYNDQGQLDHVGFTSGLTAAQRKELTPKLQKLRKPPGFTGKAPGGPSRWSRAGRSEQWEPLDPTLVVEVQYDHFTAGRFRHGTRLLRWRPDKAPRQCTLDQVGQARGSSLRMLERHEPGAPRRRKAG